MDLGLADILVDDGPRMAGHSRLEVRSSRNQCVEEQSQVAVLTKTAMVVDREDAAALQRELEDEGMLGALHWSAWRPRRWGEDLPAVPGTPPRAPSPEPPEA